MDAQNRKVASGVLVAFLVAAAFVVVPTAAAQANEVVYKADKFNDAGTLLAVQSGSAEYDTTATVIIQNLNATGYGAVEKVRLLNASGEVIRTVNTQNQGNGARMASFTSVNFDEVGTWAFEGLNSNGDVVPVYDRNNLAFEVGPADTLTVTLSKTETTFGGDSVEDITVTVTDADGNAVGGAIVDFGGIQTATTRASDGKAFFGINFDLNGGAGDYKVSATKDTAGDSAPELSGDATFTVKAITLDVDSKSESPIEGFESNVTYELSYPGTNDTSPLSADELSSNNVSDWNITVWEKGDFLTQEVQTDTNSSIVSVADDGKVTIRHTWVDGKYKVTFNVNVSGNTDPEYTLTRTFSPSEPSDVTLIADPEEVDVEARDGDGTAPTVNITVTIYGDHQYRHPHWDGRLDTDDDDVACRNDGTGDDCEVDADEFNPSEDVTVTGDYIGAVNLDWDDYTNSTGELVISGITPAKGGGEITITVNYESGASISVPIVDGAIVDASVDEVTVDTPTKVSFTVKDVYGNPQPAARVSLFWEGGANLLDEDGNPVFIEGTGAPGKGQGGVYEFNVNASTVGYIYAQARVGTEAPYNYSYARIEIVPAHDYDVAVSPSDANAGEETEITFNVTQGDDPKNAVVYVMDQEEYDDFLENGASALANVPASRTTSVTDGSTGNYSLETDLDAGAHYVYVRTSDGEHDNKGSIPTIEVHAYHTHADPSVLVKGVDTNSTVTLTVADHDGNLVNGTLALYSEDGNVSYWNTTYTGGSITLADGTTVDANVTIAVENGEVTLTNVTADEVGNVHLYFQPEATGSSYALGHGMLEVSAPDITVEPDNIFVGETNKITVTVTHPATGEPLADQDVTIPVLGAEATTGANGKATLSVFPTTNAKVKVLVNGDEAGSFTPVAGLAISFDKNKYVEGDSVTVTVSPRGSAGTESGVAISVDGTQVGMTGEAGELTFDAPAVGTHTVTASKEGYAAATKSFTVEEKPAPPPEQKAEFTYKNIKVSPQPDADGFEIGKAYTVSATVENVGNAAGDAQAELRVNDVTVQAYKVYLEPGESKTVGFTWTPTEGDTTVAINGESMPVETYEVAAGPDSVPGFTGFAALAAVGAALVLLRRRD